MSAESADHQSWVPMLLDVMTVVFIVAGLLLLWINLRARRSDVMIKLRKHSEDLGNPASEPSQKNSQTH